MFIGVQTKAGDKTLGIVVKSDRSTILVWWTTGTKQSILIPWTQTTYSTAQSISVISENKGCDTQQEESEKQRHVVKGTKRRKRKRKRKRMKRTKGQKWITQKHIEIEWMKEMSQSFRMRKREKGGRWEKQVMEITCLIHSGMCVWRTLSSFQTQWRKSAQMKDGSGSLIVNTLTQVACTVVDSLISGKVEDSHE